MLKLFELCEGGISFGVWKGVWISGEGEGGEEVDWFVEEAVVDEECGEIFTHSSEHGVSWLGDGDVYISDGLVGGGMVEWINHVRTGGGGGDENLEGEVIGDDGGGGGAEVPVGTGDDGDGGEVSKDNEGEHCWM